MRNRHWPVVTGLSSDCHLFVVESGSHIVLRCPPRCCPWPFQIWPGMKPRGALMATNPIANNTANASVRSVANHMYVSVVAEFEAKKFSHYLGFCKSWEPPSKCYGVYSSALANPNVRTVTNPCTFLQIMETSCRRLEGVHKIVLRFLQVRSVNQVQSLLVS